MSNTTQSIGCQSISLPVYKQSGNVVNSIMEADIYYCISCDRPLEAWMIPCRFCRQALDCAFCEKSDCTCLQTFPPDATPAMDPEEEEYYYCEFCGRREDDYDCDCYICDTCNDNGLVCPCPGPLKCTDE